MEFLDSLSLNTIVWSVLALLEVIVRLTPSQKDNSILNLNEFKSQTSNSGDVMHKTFKIKKD